MASPVPHKDDVERWTVEQVAAWLRQMELTDCCELFLRKGIDGRSLMELTEEGLVLWGRDISIRNRKKIMKLVRQIENQYLISTGRLQQREMFGRSPHDQGRESEESDAIEDDPGFDSDEFDDVYDTDQETMNRPHEEGYPGYADNYPDSGNADDIYLEPIKAPVTRNYPPSPSSRPLPNKPLSMHGNPPQNRQPFLPPEKRAPMPLPHSGVNQAPPTQNPPQKFGGQIGVPRLPPGLTSPSSDPPRRPPPHPVSSLPSSGITTPLWQTGSKPNPLGSSNVKAPPQLREWTQKKPSEPPSTQNSNHPESSVEGGGGGLGGRMGYASQQRPHFPLPNNNSVEGNLPNKKSNFIMDMQQKFSNATIAPAPSEAESDYEIVENPDGPYPGNESHSGNPPGLTALSQNPPPLPQRNQDGSRSGPNLQQPPVGSNVLHSRFHQQLPALPNRPIPTPGPNKPVPTPGPNRPVPTPGTGPSNIHQNRPSPSNVNQNRPPPPLPAEVSNINQNRSSPSNVNQNRSPPPLPIGTSNINQNRPSPSFPGGVPNINQNRPPVVIPGERTVSLSGERNWSQKGISSGHNVNQSRLPPPPPPQALKHQSQPPIHSPPMERAPALPSPLAPLKNPSGGFQAPGAERVPIGNGESIELKPLYRQLVDRPYFHVISRITSKQLLEKAADGAYLIRPSARSSDPLTLCLRYSGRTYNINIRQRRDLLYALGSEKDNEMTFSTIDDIVNTHTNEPLKLQNGDRVRLTTSPPKADNMYVKMPTH